MFIEDAFIDNIGVCIVLSRCISAECAFEDDVSTLRRYVGRVAGCVTGVES